MRNARPIGAGRGMACATGARLPGTVHAENRTRAQEAAPGLAPGKSCRASAHPARVCELAWVKFLRMWSPWPNAADMQSWTFRLAVLLGYTPLAVLGGWGFARNWRRDHLCWLCLLPAVYFTCLHVVFVSSIRYREPAMLPWIVLAAAAATGWRQDLSENVSSA